MTQEAVVVLVGVPVDDALLDLAADAADPARPDVKMNAPRVVLTPGLPA